ncbi:MAG: hypothetical protein SVK54_07950 [candidate division WOR-3 bacterium]|nr:hypothetical protein [candidate division WOR-3 bacterium]
MRKSVIILVLTIPLIISIVSCFLINDEPYLWVESTNQNTLFINDNEYVRVLRLMEEESLYDDDYWREHAGYRVVYGNVLSGERKEFDVMVDKKSYAPEFLFSLANDNVVISSAYHNKMLNLTTGEIKDFDTLDFVNNRKITFSPDSSRILAFRYNDGMDDYYIYINFLSGVWDSIYDYPYLHTHYIVDWGGNQFIGYGYRYGCYAEVLTGAELGTLIRSDTIDSIVFDKVNSARWDRKGDSIKVLFTGTNTNNDEESKYTLTFHPDNKNDYTLMDEKYYNSNDKDFYINTGLKVDTIYNFNDEVIKIIE